MPPRGTARTSSRPSACSREVGREEVRDPVPDHVRVVARLADQGPLEDLVLLDLDGEGEVPLAHGAAKDLHEVPLHRRPDAAPSINRLRAPGGRSPGEPKTSCPTGPSSMEAEALQGRPITH